MEEQRQLQKIAKDIGWLHAEVKTIRYEIELIREKQDSLVAQTNRWKGGFMVVLGIGATLAWLGNLFYQIFLDSK